MKILSMRRARKRLAVVWLVAAAVPFGLVLFQTISGFYGDQAERAWSWLLPTIMPTLSLVVAVMAADVWGRSLEIETVDPFMYRVALWLSLTYLVTVSLTIAMHPFSQMTPLQLMEVSSLWLGPLQGLVGAALGAFFVVGHPSTAGGTPRA